jgi:ring-1,2-phenylacetyl-CoA epoxidase subunit PaaD
LRTEVALVSTRTAAYEVAAQVVDPELRVITIAELGILRSVEVRGDRVVATITPTYSGCPAMDVIRADVATALRSAGWSEVEVVTRLHPAWTTDWITGPGRAKLAAAGIAPPGPARRVSLGLPLREPPAPVCPRCAEPGTTELSRFGSTPCKALWRCGGCGEPFEHLKSF